MDIIFHWALQTRQTDQETFINCHRNTICLYQQRFCTIACKAFDFNHTVLGGPRKICEIDEAFLLKLSIIKART